jgi:hypothetical protein
VTTTGEPGGAAPSAVDVPITYAAAAAEGKAGSVDWVRTCDPSTGRIELPTVYAPPCVPAFSGDNGGATSDGVTPTQITVAWYVPAGNADVLAALSSKLDPPDATLATVQGYADLLNHELELYGRTVRIVPFHATGSAEDPVGGLADATAVVDDLHPFASIGGPALTPAYANELARRHVLCIGCGVALPDALYQADAPYLWGTEPTPEELAQNLGDYITRRLVGRPAAHAGEADLASATRTFGVVHFEQDPPVFSDLSAAADRCGAAVGWHAATTQTYLFDPGRLAEQATTIIARLKAARVTTVVFLGDPLMPSYLTKEATRQGYHPEWIVTGTVLTDTAALGRMYDQDQWSHAFGISNLPVPVPKEETDAWRLYQWFHGTPPPAANTAATIWPDIEQLFDGIHLAGAHLTPQTFAAGLFASPPSGGGVTDPHVSYGDHGYFHVQDPETCETSGPRPDHLAIDDVSEIWWDPAAVGPDEQGTPGTGLYRHADGGRRYLPGQMPTTDIDAFRIEGSVTSFDAPPPDERAPDYPPPAR